MKNQTVNIIFGLIALFFVYQSIIQIRFDDLMFWLPVFVLVSCSIVVIIYLQYRKANYQLFRWALPVILLLIAAGIALTMTEANAWVW